MCVCVCGCVCVCFVRVCGGGVMSVYVWPCVCVCVCFECVYVCGCGRVRVVVYFENYTVIDNVFSKFVELLVLIQEILSLLLCIYVCA